MGRIAERFEILRGRKEKALIPFIAGGFPDLKMTKQFILTLAEAGADLIEIGVPFSDPLADGPTIQAAYQRALENGVTLREILILVKELRDTIETPLLLMAYYNLIYQFGEELFTAEASKCGVDGLIVPDLPPEEAGNLLRYANQVDLDLIFLAAPTTDRDRLSLITSVSKGFIYYVSVTGITGARQSLPDDLKIALSRLKELTQLPIAVGFGISTPSQVREASSLADAVIVGSALISLITQNEGSPHLLNVVRQFISQLKAGTRA